MLARAGEAIEYHYGAGENDFVAIDALLGSKKITNIDAEGQFVQFKQQYFAVDGTALATAGETPEYITPTDGHWIKFGDLRFDVTMINGTFFENPVPSGAAPGLIRIYATQTGESAQWAL